MKRRILDWKRRLSRRPILVAVAGSNGAGKSTFYEAHLKQSGLLFVNADVLASQLGLDDLQAMEAANELRKELALQRESFIFETVFSDPVGDKVQFLKDAADNGYAVLLCFVGIANASLSEQRVAIRVSQGGHDVPTDRLAARFPRTLANLRTAIRTLPLVVVFDNSDFRKPFRRLAVFKGGRLIARNKRVPRWFSPFLRSAS